MTDYDFHFRDQEEPFLHVETRNENGVFNIKGATGTIEQELLTGGILKVRIRGFLIPDPTACKSGCTPEQKMLTIDDEKFKTLTFPTKEGKPRKVRFGNGYPFVTATRTD